MGTDDDQQMYVVLEPNQEEQFLTIAELTTKLVRILQANLADLPRDLQNLPTINAQVQRLLDTSCDLELEPGQFLQWYAVRLEKD
jgi:hypothetical protein